MSEPFRLASRNGHFRVEIPAGSPLFEGHFPGHPILPGIAHLAMVEKALGTALTAVRSLKLRRPVAPGETLELSLKGPEEDAWVRFELRRGAETVSAGAVAAEESRDGVSSHAGDIQEGAFPPVGDLLPHALPARLIHGIVEASPEGIVAVAEIPAEHPLAADGLAPAFLGIEAAAQAAAVLEALNRRDTPGPRVGYLVGIREAGIGAASLPTGRPLRVAARFQGGAFPLSIYEIALGEPGREIVTGTISTFLTRGG